MKQSIWVLLVSIFLSFRVSAQHTNDYKFHLYLIGDAGEPTIKNVAYKKLLQQQLSSDAPSAIVFLGDNIYPNGMPDEGNRQRKNAEDILTEQIDIAGGFTNNIFFVPGNHDWKKGHRKGLDYVMNQQAWVDSLKRENIKLLPGNGCPGPVEVPLSEYLVLVIIDTQWWLHRWRKPEGDASRCACKAPADVIVKIEDIIKRNSGKHVIIVGHHPIITYGEHGGVYSFKDHIFPLVNLNKNLYIPLPIVGSIYPLYRKFFGSRQDIAHSRYRQLSSRLMELFEKHPRVIYAAGHEHSLQYNVKDSIYYIVSGAGSKTSFVKKKKYAQYVASQMGYVRLSINGSREAELEFISENQITFRKNIGAAIH
jgi:predicted phosphodiesterase